jgi:hypothetical protein
MYRQLQSRARRQFDAGPFILRGVQEFLKAQHPKARACGSPNAVRTSLAPFAVTRIHLRCG